MIEATRQQLRETLGAATNPALWCSFGKDSLLLLRLAKDAGFHGPIYYFADELTGLAERYVVEDDITVYSWPPADRYLVPNGSELAQIDEYVVGQKVVPLVSPVRLGSRCTHGEFERYRRPSAYLHDITLTGYKRDETCPAVGVTFPAVLDIGVTKLVSPLYDWTDQQVYDACRYLGIQYEESNSVEYCDNCLNIINQSDWDRAASLAAFRQRFGFDH
jgi:hypothetical protein